MYDLHPELRERITLVEYHVNTPMSSMGQAVEPMYQAMPDLVKRFSGRASDSCWGANVSLDFAFNRTKGLPYSVSEDTASINTIIAACGLTDSAPVSVAIASSWNAASGTVSGTLSAVFDAQVAAGDYRIGLFVVEDSVTGPIPNYRQYDDKYIPLFYTDTYPFPDVLRGEVLSASTDIWGAAGIIPALPEPGIEYRREFTYTVPDLFYDIAPRIEHIRLVAFVAKKPAFPIPVQIPCILNCNWRDIHDTSSVAMVQGVSGGVPVSLSVTRINHGVRVALPESGSYRINAYTASGRLLSAQTLLASPGITHAEMPLEFSGMILVRISGPRGERSCAVPSIVR